MAVGDHAIPTGTLRIDGQPVSLEVRQHEHYRGLDLTTGSGVTGADGTYSAHNVLPSLSGDKRVLLRAINQALREGRRVTAPTDKLGQANFTRIGPIVFGMSERQTLESVGRFGLKRMLGLKRFRLGAEVSPSPQALEP